MQIELEDSVSAVRLLPGRSASRRPSCLHGVRKLFSARGREPTLFLRGWRFGCRSSSLALSPAGLGGGCEFRASRG
jgi:hypothetical protein